MGGGAFFLTTTERHTSWRIGREAFLCERLLVNHNYMDKCTRTHTV